MSVHSRDIYITSEQEAELDGLMGEQSLTEFCGALASVRSLVVQKCYIRCNTKHDPPLGDMIVRVELEGLEADVDTFCMDLLHLISQVDVTVGGDVTNE